MGKLCWKYPKIFGDTFLYAFDPSSSLMLRANFMFLSALKQNNKPPAFKQEHPLIVCFGAYFNQI